ncbi:MAG: ribonuclease III [Actinomycetota bacterium]
MEPARADSAITPLERALGVRFRDPALRDLALTHRSHAFEESAGTHNERLEFLGDAVLDLVVAEMAYRGFPDLQEGDLAPLRAAIVNMTALADVARSLDLGDALFLGRGEEKGGGRDKPSILADALEAIFGAVYLDLGPDAARDLIERLFRPRMMAYVRGEGGRDYKSLLQQRASSDLREVPDYRIEEQGPDHLKEFTATVHLGGRAFGTGTGRSKKEAEQRAAREALLALDGSAERGE